MTEQHSVTAAPNPENVEPEAHVLASERPRRAYETPQAVRGRSVHSVTLALGSGGAAPSSPTRQQRR